MIIKCNVINKIARISSGVVAICGNSDYVIQFTFDEEWDAYETKTARFKWNSNYTDVVFTGNECPMPIVQNTYNVEIGVYAGNLHTTTSAYLPMNKSILCDSGFPLDPPDDVYNQIMKRLNQISGALSTAQITALDNMFKAAAYKEDASAVYAAFREAFGLTGDEPDEPSEETWSITNTLTNATTSNSATSVAKGGSYSATITAEDGYTISSVTVTMGGVDITDTAYADGVITIAAVTGDVIIIVLATAATNPGWAKDVPYNITWEDGIKYNGTGVATESADMSNSGYLPCDGLRYLDVAGAYLNNGANCYDAEKNWIGNAASGHYESALLVPLVRDAKYVIVNKRVASDAQVTPRELPFLGEQTVPVAGQKYALDIQWKKTVWNATGEEKDTSNEDQFCSSFCLCYGFATLTLDTKVRSVVKFYDANKQYLSDAILSVSSATANIPEGATYFRYDNGNYTKTYPYVILEEAAS